ncbi:MAG TPA: transcriptional repressor LexA, partial [Haliangium sp.]|nr:transcriptional repressor LexA [Haliangium sp.]
MPDALTLRQREILEFITSFIQERGYPPTLREIGEHFGIRSTNGVNDHLKALEKKGFLAREDLKSRAMWPVNGARGEHGDARGQVIPLRKPAAAEDDSVVDVPILGRVAAGVPILAVENIEDRVRVDRFFLGTPPQEVFGLRVVGESMIEDGILDGD